MKRIITAILASFLIFAAKANQIEYSQLYLIGEGTPAGWDTGKAPSMQKIDYGVFEWTGELKAGKEFKFINTRGWYKNILSAVPDVIVELGKTYNLDFYAAWDLKGKDWKFKMPETGTYTIIVDLRNMKMKIEKAADKVDYPDHFYVTGSAVDNKVVELTNMHNAEYKNVVSCKPGNIIIMDTPTVTESTRYYGPRYEDVDIMFGKGYSVALQPVDSSSKGWSVGTPGDYTIYIDHSNYAYQSRKFIPRKVLYIVGGCCEVSWDYSQESNKYFYPNPENPEEMVWEGILRYGSAAEPNKFKILTAESWSSETFHPYVEDQLAEGPSGARISGGGDLKWTINREGYYKLTINTKTEILTGEYFGTEAPEIQSSDKGAASIDEVDCAQAEVYASDRVVYVNAESNVDVCVYDCAGNTVAKVCNHTAGAVTGRLMPGIYLVSAGSHVTKLAVN